MSVEGARLRAPQKVQSLSVKGSKVWQRTTDHEEQQKYADLFSYVSRLWRLNILEGGAGDPTCANGLANLDYTQCCKASCGICEEDPLCGHPAEYYEKYKKNADDCCPSNIKLKYVAPKYKTCKGKSAPCNLPAGLKAKMTGFKIPEEYGRHAMDDCNEAVPNLMKLFKESMAKGETRGEIYNEVENACNSALKVADKVEFESVQKQKKRKEGQESC